MSSSSPELAYFFLAVRDVCFNAQKPYYPVDHYNVPKRLDIPIQLQVQQGITVDCQSHLVSLGLKADLNKGPINS